MGKNGQEQVRLEDFGWTEILEEAFEPYRERGLLAGRIILDLRGVSTVVTEQGELEARVSGRMRHQAEGKHDLPAIGDWVAIEGTATSAAEGRIVAVLPRRTKVSRKAAGLRTDEQVVAANVDALFVVMGLDSDFSPRRLERFLATAWESGAQPVVLLNKADLAEDLDLQLEQVNEVVMGAAPVHVLQAKHGKGMEALRPYLHPGSTIALVGSSGVGKSTLINQLAGDEVMKTAEVRASDETGQHTTSHRELIRLEGGALLIDNPGIRELQLWTSEESLAGTFEDIEELAAGCRFRDCTHNDQPGCAVQQAIEDGDLDESRLTSYFALQKELDFLERRQNQSAALLEKKKWRAIHKNMRRTYKNKRGS